MDNNGVVQEYVQKPAFRITNEEIELNEQQIASIDYVSIHQISNFPSAFPLALSRAVSIASS